ncbi:MAG: MotA/TolQ/ExbB proton channel family protein [Puniceicoccaceae bacterium]
MKNIIKFTLLALLPLTAGAQLSQVESEAQADLDKALARFSDLQQTIKNEKIPLAKELNDLKAELRDTRREAERAQRFKDNSTIDLNSLQDRVTKRQEQLDYVANLVADFGERFSRDISMAELQVYSEQIEEFSAAANSVDEEDELGKAKRLLAQAFILETSINRFKDLIGSQTIKGQAVVEGEVSSGTFLLVGPTTYFAGSSAEEAGIALKGQKLPDIIGMRTDLNEQVLATVNSGSGMLPLDPTLGSALALASQEETVWEHIQKGGIWIYPILFFAFLATVTALFKVFEIYSVKMPKPGALHDVLKALNDGDRDKAMEFAKAVDGPARAMLVDAVEHSDESKELVEEVMYERMLEVQPRLERLLPFIAVTAATAPLMGLLGTVTGMINTFKLITVFGTGDAKQLSSGISEALVTTEFGLIVAIPSLIMHALLNRRAQGVMANMERMAVAFVNGLVRKN